MQNLFGRIAGTLARVSATLQQLTLQNVEINGLNIGPMANRFLIQTVTAVAAPVFNMNLGNYVVSAQTTNVAQLIGIPTNPRTGLPLIIEFRNTSGGAAGAVTWNAVFKITGAWTSAANNNNRKICFVYNGTNWVEQWRQTSDTPN